ncbi:MAG: acyl-CoA desaturase [Bacteroidetes bacterium]|nr:MAG: acyl-CoA desaturase [Bacteroidota bacterium]
MSSTISFAQNPNLEFKKVLHQRVDNYFKETGLSKNYNSDMVIKSITMLSLYILPFIVMLAVPLPFWISLMVWFIMGIGVAGIGMSVMHDANHAGYSKSQKVNRWMGLTMNLLGADAYNWKIKHNKLHHVFTNIYGKDEDINSRAILRFAYASPLKKYHRFQYIYAWALYSLMSLSMIIGDIPKRFAYRRKGETNLSASRFRKSVAWLVAGKSIYIFVLIILPIMLTGLLWWQVLIGFLIMHLVAGTIMSLVFQMAHVVEGPHQAIPDQEGRIEDTLIEHQMKSTADFSKNNKILSWYVGGLNFQVEHHLYPKICHVHYPAISKIVEKTTEEFDIPYYVYDKFSDAFKAHTTTLKKLGRIQVER